MEEQQQVVMTRMRVRSRDLNAKGNGKEEHRRVRLPSGEVGWASDLGQNHKGGWLPRGSLAANRSCTESAEFPVGTIVVDFERKFRGFSGQGRAEVTVGRIDGLNSDGKTVIVWGTTPFTRKSDGTVIVELPDGSKVEV